MAKDKAKSYGQYDQGPGQRYARGKKEPQKRPGVSSKPVKASSRAAEQRVKTEDEVRADMRRHRRDVLRGGWDR